MKKKSFSLFDLFSTKKKQKKTKQINKHKKAYSIKKFPAAKQIDTHKERLIACGNKKKLLTNEKESFSYLPTILKEYIDIIGTKNLWKQLSLYPYVNEHLKGSCIVDRVNCPILPKHVVSLLSRSFSVKIKKTPEIKMKSLQSVFKVAVPFSKTAQCYQGSHDPASFLEYCKQLNQSHFIVSHSKFCEKLYTLITHKKYKSFTNLSCFVLHFHTQELIGLSIHKSEHKWKSSKTINFNKSLQPTKKIIIMRHCPGCHQLTKHVWEKRGLSGLFANCIPVGIHFLHDNVDSLYENIFEKQPTKYKAGSSTSFRACLTMCCVNNVIGKYHSKLTK